MTSIAVVDTETDCLDGDEGDARVIELAVVELVDHGVDGQTWLERASSSALYFSDSVTPRAQAVHHLSNQILAEWPEFGAAEWVLATDADYYAAHNAAFDRRVIERAVGQTKRPWICTLKCARVAWPDAPAYGNQVLRYWRRIERLAPPDLHPHRALYDAMVTSWLLVELIAAFDGDLDRMAQITLEPSLLTRCTLPKHRGKLWSEVPKDYLRWILSKEFDEDTAHTARYWLTR